MKGTTRHREEVEIWIMLDSSELRAICFLMFPVTELTITSANYQFCQRKHLETNCTCEVEEAWIVMAEDNMYHVAPIINGQ